MNRLKMLGLSLMLATLATVSIGLEATLAAGTAATTTTIKLSSSQRLDDNGTPMKGQLILSAVMTAPDGKTINGQVISFYENVDLLGTRQALLGTATTDSTGSAAIAYQPAQSGNQTIIARSVGSAGFAAAEGQMSLDVSEVVPPFRSEAKPLASIGDAMAIIFGVATAGTWLVLLGVLLRAIVGIRSAGPLANGEATAALDPTVNVVGPRG